ncbi:App1 family protein [Deinococcus peraridilitoris]|uniref:Phosphatidate phosphatase APP1 catalytic domain-containing protein n=1 Tax=Deinococcus peraridilitoris (strain DSM 19664 / LMG 22246 / CIP 109416 / KR-200) TaxID=937777 RepID=K9ZVW2_DEIPD|nr:phosphatase domain-containing protein [Deinococcus peraridilitoris]AFZ65763.1 hypothetical protein Deipe_0159 [Deinococcus peraridilitoris DSM 19664]
MRALTLKLLGNLSSLLGGRLHRFVQRRRSLGILGIVGFTGHGTPDAAVLDGRVLRPQNLLLSNEQASRWQNARNVARRFASREATNILVRGSLYGASAEAQTDDEGYFKLRFRFGEPLADGWHTATLTLPHLNVRSEAPVRIVAGADFGVISDLDDTVVQTGVTRLWQMIGTVLFGNAHTRLPFPGVGALYRALTCGAGGTSNNPLFYVSSSPWNLFDMLWTFLEYRRIPLGPIFLRDWGLHIFRSGHHSHKLDAIEELFRTYPNLPFVLIGDSGEQDPEIYREVVHRHPQRVLAVYIRDVADARRDLDVLRLRAELRVHNIDLVLASDSLAAAHHAHALGLIQARGVREVGEAT